MMTSRTKIVGIIALILLISVVGVLSGLLFFISSEKTELANRRLEVAEAQMHEQELAALARLVEESKEEREQLRSYMLYEEDIIDFLALLEKLAREQGTVLTIDALDVGGIDETFEELRLSITLRGEYDAVMHTMQLLETLPYQSYVDSVTLSRSGEGANMWNADIQLRVAKYKEQNI